MTYAAQVSNHSVAVCVVFAVSWLWTLLGCLSRRIQLEYGYTQFCFLVLCLMHDECSLFHTTLSATCTL